MKHVVFSGLRANVSRLVATGLAVMLSVGFVVAMLTLSATFTHTTEQLLTANMSRADARVDLNDTDSQPAGAGSPSDQLLAELPTIRAVDGVTGADAERSAYVEIRSRSDRSIGEVSGLLDESVRWQALKSGAWPTSNLEVALDPRAASSLEVALGDTISISVGEGAGEKNPITLNIVGIMSDAAGRRSRAPALVMTHDGLTASGVGAHTNGVLVAGRGAPRALANSVTTALAGTPGTRVLTHDDAVNATITQVSGGSSVLTSCLLGFAVIALFVAALVIANTFHVLVAQRTKELALLRCVGASAGQVYRLILSEATLLGVVTSCLGVILGVGGSELLALFSRLGSSDLTLGDLVIDPSTLLIGFAAGVLLPIISALSPARRATGVRPVVALGLRDGASIVTRKGGVQALIALILIVGGAAGLAFGATAAGLEVTLLSGIVCFVGVLVGSTFFIPWAVRIAGLSIAWISVPTRLSSLNATRNPGRTAATAAALLVGVTLVSIMVVGTFSVRESMNANLDRKYPIDLVVDSNNPRGFSPDQVNTIAALQGVGATTVVDSGATVTVTHEGKPAAAIRALGVDPSEISRVSRSQEFVPRPGHVLFRQTSVATVQPGQSVEIEGANARANFVAQLSGDAMPDVALFTLSDLKRVHDEPVHGMVLVRLSSEVTGANVQKITKKILSLSEDYVVDGGAPLRAYYGEILDTMLLIALALLAITVIIAVVGIGNTLALSVLERRRESALLRALGLSARQLGGMLAAEAGLVALVGALLGVGLGIVFSWAGLLTLGLETPNLPLSVHVPWSQLSVILGGALLAGLAASIVPAVSAVKQSPVEGLARG